MKESGLFIQPFIVEEPLYSGRSGPKSYTLVGSFEKESMSQRCPKCHRIVRELARYCARCGQSLSGSADANSEGRAALPLLSPPLGFSVCDGACEVSYKWESNWGGRSLLSTETLAVLLFNAGETRADVFLKITAMDARGRTLATLRPTAALLPRGETVRVEVPSYELPDEIASFKVVLTKEQPAEQSR